MYRDGVSLGTRSHSSVIQDTAGEPLYIGAGPLGSDEFSNGAVDETRVWSVVRTGAEIAAAKDAMLTGSETGLVGYWRCVEGSGFTTGRPLPERRHPRAWGSGPASRVGRLRRAPCLYGRRDRSRAGDRSLQHPPQRAASINAANDRLIVAGNDGLFRTGDDGAYALTPITSGFASRSIAFLLDPQPLQPGRYRFSTSEGLTDRAGDAITPFEKPLTIVAPTPTAPLAPPTDLGHPDPIALNPATPPPAPREEPRTAALEITPTPIAITSIPSYEIAPSLPRPVAPKLTATPPRRSTSHPHTPSRPPHPCQSFPLTPPNHSDSDSKANLRQTTDQDLDLLA